MVLWGLIAAGGTALAAAILVLGLRICRFRREIRELTLFKKAAENGKAGMAILNRDGTSIKYVNREHARLHGYEPEELVGTDPRRK